MLPFETEQNKLKIYLYISGLLDMVSIILEKTRALSLFGKCA